MEKFNEQEYWNNRYSNGGNSGAGSYNQEAIMKATIINHWIDEFNIRTINEYCCGDGNNLLLYKVPISLTGYDFSPKAIEICNQKTLKIRNALKYYFTSDVKDMDYDADLCLALDCWFHMVNDEVFNDFCHTLFEVGNWKYIIIYSTDTNSQFTPEGLPLSSHMKQREVLSKIEEYSEWHVLYWISGLSVNQNGQVKNQQFPSEKRFYLLERLTKPLEDKKV